MTHGVKFLQDREKEAEHHNRMSRERCCHLIYWAGLPSLDLGDEGTEEEMRGGKGGENRQSKKERGGMGKIKTARGAGVGEKLGKKR